MFILVLHTTRDLFWIIGAGNLILGIRYGYVAINFYKISQLITSTL